jgi:hypothetical protein
MSSPFRQTVYQPVLPLFSAGLLRLFLQFIFDPPPYFLLDPPSYLILDPRLASSSMRCFASLRP